MEMGSKARGETKEEIYHIRRRFDFEAIEVAVDGDKALEYHRVQQTCRGLRELQRGEGAVAGWYRPTGLRVDNLALNLLQREEVPRSQAHQPVHGVSNDDWRVSEQHLEHVASSSVLGQNEV